MLMTIMGGLLALLGFVGLVLALVESMSATSGNAGLLVGGGLAFIVLGLCLMVLG